MAIGLGGGALGATITGTVGDQYEPLVGVTVMVQGTQIGATTDFDGNFSLTYSGSQATLVVSYIGYVTQYYCWQTGKTPQIILCEDDETANPSCAGTPCDGGNTPSVPTSGCVSDADCTSSTTAWTAHTNTGYMQRTVGKCNSLTATCIGALEYKCADGYFGSSTDGQTGCDQCNSNYCCGRVYSSDGEKLIGATVVMTATPSAGTVADADGVFMLSGCGAGTDLTFLSIGYARYETTATSSNKSNMSITMMEDVGEASCSEGYYMNWVSPNQSKCVQCPTDSNGVSGTIAANHDGTFSNRIIDCYARPGIAYTDDMGQWEFTSNCKYSK